MKTAAYLKVESFTASSSSFTQLQKSEQGVIA